MNSLTSDFFHHWFEYIQNWKKFIAKVSICWVKNKILKSRFASGYLVGKVKVDQGYMTSRGFERMISQIVRYGLDFFER